MKKIILFISIFCYTLSIEGQDLVFYNFKDTNHINKVLIAVTYIGDNNYEKGWNFGQGGKGQFDLTTYFGIGVIEKTLLGKYYHMAIYSILTDGNILTLKPYLFTKKVTLDAKAEFSKTYLGRLDNLNARIDSVRKYVEYFKKNELELEQTIAQANLTEEKQINKSATNRTSVKSKKPSERLFTEVVGFSNERMLNYSLEAIINALNQEGLNVEYGKNSTLYYKFKGMGDNLVVYEMEKSKTGMKLTDIEHCLKKEPLQGNGFLKPSEHLSDYLIFPISLDNSNKKSKIFLDKIKTKLEQFRDDKDFIAAMNKKDADELSKEKEKEILMGKQLEIQKEFYGNLSKACQNWEEGDKVCLFYYTTNNSNATSRVQAFVEKYNSAKTKIHLRIHQANNYANQYDNINFNKGDVIWINLPCYTANLYWNKCK